MSYQDLAVIAAVGWFFAVVNGVLFHLEYGLCHEALAGWKKSLERLGQQFPTRED